MEVRPYAPALAEIWNTLNAAASAGHFMFDRGFMDYHADRYADCSMVIFENDAPIALFPANQTGREAWSHQGLTFGGLIALDLGVTRTLAALDACARQLKALGLSSLIYKAAPWIYHRAPAQDDLYWLFSRDATLYRRDVSIAIDYRSRGRSSDRRKRGVRKAERAGVCYQRSDDWSAFWRLLTRVLAERHDARPVHTQGEIELLAARFPEDIRLYTASDDAGLRAGVVMFRSAQVAHAQYIAVDETGRAVGALDGLLDYLIKAHATTHRYLDFGISNTEEGRRLNEGLIRQKEEFGGGAVVHDFYRVSID